MTAAEKRQAVLEMCVDHASAVTTGNQRVIKLVAEDIGRRLSALLPDPPPPQQSGEQPPNPDAPAAVPSSF